MQKSPNMISRSLIRFARLMDACLIGLGCFIAGSSENNALFAAGLLLSGASFAHFCWPRPPHPLLNLRQKARGPVQSLSGFAQLLAQDSPVEERDRHTKVLNSALNDLKAMLDATADIIRLEHGDLRLIWQENDIKEILGLNVKTAQHLARAQSIRFTCDPLPDAKLHGDATRLSQILSALFNHAMLQSPADHHLHLGLKRKNSSLELSLNMPAANLSMREKPDLSLHLAQALAQAHGGQLKATDMGFSLRLPTSLR